MNFFAVSTLATCISSFVLSFFVIYKGKSELSRYWFWVSFLMGVWSLGLWGVVRAGSYNEALLFQYILDSGAIMIPVAYFRFVLSLLSFEDKNKKEFYLYIIFSSILVFLSFFPIFKEGVHSNLEVFEYWIQPGPIYFLFPTFFTYLMFRSFYLLLKHRKGYNGLVRNQILYIFIAGFIGFLGGATNFFPQIFGLYPIGNYFVISYIAAVTYAILKFRLMGIRVIASKMYVTIIIALFSYISFYIIYYFEDTFLGGVYSSNSLSFGLILGVVFASIMLPLMNHIQRSSDVLFFKGYNPRRIIKDITIELKSVIDLDQIFKILTKSFKRVLANEEAHILIFRDGGGVRKELCVSKRKSFNCKNININSSLFKKVVSNKKILVRDELKSKQFKKELDRLEVKIISPLVSSNKVIGVIMLGEKISQGGYTQEDIEFLEIISTQAAVAMENALLYQEVAEARKNLQKKVDEQTKDLKEQADHLKKLLEMRSEFLDIASHQLRTPVSVIKGMLSMIINKSVNKKKEAEFLDACFKKSKKLTDIINDILRASEMDTDKFELDMEKVNIQTILEGVYNDKKQEAEENGVKFELKIVDKKLPLVMSDERYITQAILNLVNNSLQYTKEGSIKIQGNVEDDYVLIRVSDTGIGIPKKDQKKLFQKFARAENAVNAYTDGSGLGLFIIKQVIDAHEDADVYIEESELNKGTTIVIKLPVAK